MGFGPHRTSEAGRYRQRRVMARASVLVGLTWTLAGAALISTTATAGLTSHLPDFEFRRSTMIEDLRVTITPPRLASLPMIGDQPEARLEFGMRSASRLLPHIRKVDLSRERIPTRQPGQPLLFVDDALLIPGQKLDPVLNLARASHLLTIRMTRFEGRTPLRTTGATTPVESPVPGISRAALTLTRPDGSTPPVSRAVALASVTPAPMEPEIIQATSLRIPSIALINTAPQPSAPTTSYAIRLPQLDLSDPQTAKREMKCLAEAVYFEARSEPEAGQAAVAQVVINRAKSGLYPTSICGVVYQNRHRYKACQFTFACEGKALTIREPEAWERASRIVQEVLEGNRYLQAVGSSTHYHADYVSPYWSRKLKRTDRIGRHIFYKLRPGQT
jgi:spore germination cell wall hydrolase CwlJ-like protein